MSSTEKKNVCGFCGSLIPENSKFCLECGKEQTNGMHVCPNCGKLVPAGKFCLECGHSAAGAGKADKKTAGGKKNVFLAILATAVVFLAIIVGLFATGAFSNDADPVGSVQIGQSENQDYEIEDSKNSENVDKEETTEPVYEEPTQPAAVEEITQPTEVQEPTQPVVTIDETRYQEKFANCKVGDRVTYGTYGGGEVSWIVLDIKGDQVLVISEYVLDCVPYNEKKTNVTWETCTLRSWLNNDFLNTAFTEDEQSIIALSTVKAELNPEHDTHPGNNTQDRIFVLSVNEAESYFGSNLGKCPATIYAVENGADTFQGKSYWWLRSPGSNHKNATLVMSGGNCASFSVNKDDVGVRPAMWIDLGA